MGRLIDGQTLKDTLRKDEEEQCLNNSADLLKNGHGP